MEQPIRSPILPKFEILIENDERRYNLRPRKRPVNGPSSPRKRTCFSHTGMNFHDVLLQVKKEGCISNRWIMVSICNRRHQDDLDLIFRENIRIQSVDCFVFLKMRKGGHSAKEYSTFYGPVQDPYLAILDPFTGMNVESWKESESQAFLCLMESFLQNHGLPDGRQLPISAFTEPVGVLSIKESQHELDPQKEVAPDYENMYMGSEDEEVEVEGVEENSVIMIRMPNGEKRQIVRSSSTTLRYLVSFVHKLGFDRLQYNLVMDYPRQNLFDSDLHLTLKQAKLCPRVVIYIECKD